MKQSQTLFIINHLLCNFPWLVVFFSITQPKCEANFNNYPLWTSVLYGTENTSSESRIMFRCSAVSSNSVLIGSKACWILTDPWFSILGTLKDIACHEYNSIYIFCYFPAKIYKMFNSLIHIAQKWRRKLPTTLFMRL